MGPSKPFASSVPRSSPWAKLCGVRDAATASALGELRPDAIGLNFYSKSSRFVTRDEAVEIARALPAGVAAVGVFVNATVDDVLDAVASVGLDAVQLHGDEPPEAVAELKRRRPGLAVVRAWRVGPEGLGPLGSYLDSCGRLGARPDAILVDAKFAGAYGGTGRTAPWELLREYPGGWPPLILAGGLTPGNVAAAMAAVRPWGVDTAGGVESEEGVKDPALSAAFLAAVRSGER